MKLSELQMEKVVEAALIEDIGYGDITTDITIPDDAIAIANIKAKQCGVIAGIPLAFQVFCGTIEFPYGWYNGAFSEFEPKCNDGASVKPGDVLVYMKGQAKTILKGERVALNFLQRLSGIATLTAEYVSLVSHTKARIADTRKTTHGLRQLEKYAVTVGGGVNHRFNLSDGILIKDNHIAVAGGVGNAVTAAKARAPHTLKIEVEVSDLDMLKEAIGAGADTVLLDNMSLDMMRAAVEMAGGKVLLEASGGVNESNVASIAETGVDIISVGALTHSAPALDISLDITVS